MLMLGCPDISKKSKPFKKAGKTDMVERIMTPEDLKEFHDVNGHEFTPIQIGECAETYHINKNLDAIEKDKKKSDPKVEVHRQVGEFTRDQMLQFVKERLECQGAPYFHLYYCGHGTKSGDIPTFDGKTINLKDIVNMVLDTCQAPRVTKIYIELDCCFSGCWVDQFREIETKNILEDIKIWVNAECAKDKQMNWNACLPKNTIDKKSPKYARLLAKHFKTYGDCQAKSVEF